MNIDKRGNYNVIVNFNETNYILVKSFNAIIIL